MASKLTDVLSPEGELPDTGDRVGLMDSLPIAKAVAIASFGALAGYGVGRWAYNNLKSATNTGSDSIPGLEGL